MALPFLSFGYRLGSGASTARIAVWRALRELGAAPFPKGLSLLPDREGILERLEALRAQVSSAKGQARVARLSFVLPEDEAAAVDSFRHSRDEEYGALEEGCDRLVWGLDRKAGRDSFALHELEAGEAELARLRRWAAKIEARDFFRAGGRGKAEAALVRAEARLRAYALEVYRRGKA